MNKHVICFGNIAFDLIPDASNIKRLSYEVHIGGSICNTAVMLSRMNIAVSMLSKTGTDFLSKKILRMLESEGITTEHVMTHPCLKPTLAFADLDEEGNSKYVFYKSEGNAMSIDPDSLPYDTLETAQLLHTGSSFSYDPDTFEAVSRFIKAASEKNVYITFDPNWRDGRVENADAARKRIISLLPYIDLLKLSIDDAKGITASDSTEKALDTLASKLKGEMIVTNGKSGSFYYIKDQDISVPAVKVDVADTIGAGDAFTAGLIYRYITTDKDVFMTEKKDNLTFATVAASLVCLKNGATSGLTSAGQIEKFLKGIDIE